MGSFRCRISRRSALGNGHGEIEDSIDPSPLQRPGQGLVSVGRLGDSIEDHVQPKLNRTVLNALENLNEEVVGEKRNDGSEGIGAGRSESLSVGVRLVVESPRNGKNPPPGVACNSRMVVKTS